MERFIVSVNIVILLLLGHASASSKQNVNSVTYNQPLIIPTERPHASRRSPRSSPRQVERHLKTTPHSALNDVDNIRILEWVAPSVPGEDTAPPTPDRRAAKRTPMPSVWVAPSVPGEDTPPPTPDRRAAKRTPQPSLGTEIVIKSRRPHYPGESDDDTVTRAPTEKPTSLRSPSIQGINDATARPTLDDYAIRDETISYGGIEKRGTIWYISGLLMCSTVVLVW
jgi:hypothetical protein